MRSVLLFGTSANPPTGPAGHQGLVRWAVAHPRYTCFEGPADEVWVLPVFRHAYAEKRGMPDFDHRLALARLAFEPLGARVQDTERRLAEAFVPRHESDRPGTIDLVRFLEEEHPDTRWALLLGADTYLDLVEDRWKESQKLRSRVGLVVVGRAGEKRVQTEPGAPVLGPVSSSRLRADRDPEHWARELDPQVWQYIQQHRLYGFGSGRA